MPFKVCLVLACAAAVLADNFPEENNSHPNYEFAYAVNDPTTGDVKAHQENRDGDSVQGQYYLNDADGYKRIVDYTVNGDSGFKAVVRREPLTSANEVNVKQSIVKAKPIVQKLVVQSPAYLRHTVVHHHQPATLYQAAAPVFHLGHSAHHIVHGAPTTTLLKSSPAVITTHHSPTVVHHAPATVVHHHTPSAYVHYH